MPFSRQTAARACSRTADRHRQQYAVRALADYMPGVRQAIVTDLPRRRLGMALQRELAGRLREGHYGQALVMSRKWKAARTVARRHTDTNGLCW